jgi:hypothetical protein
VHRDGSIINNGTIDLYSYCEGDITRMTGTGTLNDHRQVHPYQEDGG